VEHPSAKMIVRINLDETSTHITMIETFAGM
jgi:hypothetical protein